jgi:hypothetical protein
MSKFDLVFLNGVPYFVGTDGSVFTYECGKDNPIHIGNWDKAAGKFNLHDDWRERCNERRNTWQHSLGIIERGKVRATFKTAKLSKSRKNNGSS